jgi:two-component system, cell cycle response regulator DivK
MAAMTKILLVEDHEELWDFLSRRLRRRGFAVVLAHDGRQALDQVSAETPDVVLLDMDLPVMDGWTVASTLRRDDATRTLPLIALTAHGMAGDEAKALAAGCDAYHAKPVEFDRLLDQIDELLLRREQERP